MERLVYTPRVDVFIKTQDGSVVDLSPYVTNCSVNRKLNQVSTASVTFRNPNRMFTNYQTNDANGTPRIDSRFKPMDPIIIVMTRLRNYPIQVFTGYCDTTPYMALYPGTVSLTASCTLKRLLYTFFDPGLPFFTQFLVDKGWVRTEGYAFNPTDLSKPKGKDGNQNDGSIGKLLESILVEIGNWDKENIFIEDLPKSIVDQAEKLYPELEQTSKQAAEEFKQFLHQIIGTSATESSGPSGSDVSSVPGVPSELLPIYKAAAERYKLGSDGWAYLAAINRIETDFGRNLNTSSAGAQGWMQFMPGTWASYGVDANGDGKKDPNNPKDAIYAAANYLRASGAPNDWQKAIFAYNHAQWYVDDVVNHAKEYIRTAKRANSSSNSDVVMTTDFPVTPTNWTLTGLASTFGDSHKYHYDDPGDDSYGNQKPASGLSPDVPGIATYNSSRTNGWWVIRAPNGKCAALRQTDVGPAPGTGCVFDINTPATYAFGWTPNSFPTKQGTWRGYYCGKGEQGRKKAEKIVANN